jgi:hypothetical protein
MGLPSEFVITAEKERVVISHGPLGKRPKTMVLPAALCKGGTASEALRQVQEKLKLGFRIIESAAPEAPVVSVQMLEKLEDLLPSSGRFFK